MRRLLPGVVAAFVLVPILGAAGTAGAPPAAAASSANRSASKVTCHVFTVTQGMVRLRFLGDIGVIDPSGCRSTVYEILSPGVPRGFFAGAGFRSGITAYEYGTAERTELVDGRQEIVVVNPTASWRQAFAGFDSCHSSRSTTAGVVTTCTAPALLLAPPNWWAGILLVLLLTLLVLAVIHLTRPAGPVRRRRHYRDRQRALMHSVHKGVKPDITAEDIEDIERRLRRLEKKVSPELSESQRSWFAGHLATGRHGLALESLTRWLAERRLPVSPHMRNEIEWVASSLHIERMVLPILDAEKSRGELPAGGPGEDQGIDVPLERFQDFVSEALDALPDEFGKAMVNVAVFVEEEAEGEELFGVYIGTPLTKRWHYSWSVPPDRINIYRRTICAYCRSEAEVRAEVYRTVIHEIAHHFGISDPRLKDLGW